MFTELHFFTQLDGPILIAIGGLGASFILSVCQLGWSLAKAGRRS